MKGDLAFIVAKLFSPMRDLIPHTLFYIDYTGNPQQTPFIFIGKDGTPNYMATLPSTSNREELDLWVALTVSTKAKFKNGDAFLPNAIAGFWLERDYMSDPDSASVSALCNALKTCKVAKLLAVLSAYLRGERIADIVKEMYRNAKSDAVKQMISECVSPALLV